MKPVYRLALPLAVAAALTPACDASQDEPSATEATLDGVFSPEEPGDNEIEEIEFRDAQYRLRVPGCADEDCEELGTFRLDEGAAKLHLVAVDSGATRALDLDVLESEEHDAEADDAKAAEITPANLRRPPQRLLKGRRYRLLRRVRLLKRRYAQQKGSCTSDQLAYS